MVLYASVGNMIRRMRKRGEVGIYEIHKKPTMTIVTRAMFVSRLEIYDVIRFVSFRCLRRLKG